LWGGNNFGMAATRIRIPGTLRRLLPTTCGQFGCAAPQKRCSTSSNGDVKDCAGHETMTKAFSGRVERGMAARVTARPKC